MLDDAGNRLITDQRHRGTKENIGKLDNNDWSFASLCGITSTRRLMCYNPYHWSNESYARGCRVFVDSVQQINYFCVVPRLSSEFEIVNAK